jgi:hypothetical protein
MSVPQTREMGYLNERKLELLCLLSPDFWMAYSWINSLRTYQRAMSVFLNCPNRTYSIGYAIFNRVDECWYLELSSRHRRTIAIFTWNISRISADSGSRPHDWRQMFCCVPRFSSLPAEYRSFAARFAKIIEITHAGWVCIIVCIAPRRAHTPRPVQKATGHRSYGPPGYWRSDEQTLIQSCM